MKRIIATLSILLLSGCFSTNETVVETAPEGMHFYATKEYKIVIPNEWEVIEPTKFTTQTPPNTLIAFRNNVRNENFTANVVIVKNALSTSIPTSDYARLLVEKLKTELIGFAELEIVNKPIAIGSTQETTLFTFVEGRDRSNGDLKRFAQSSGVKEKNAYIAIGSFLSDDLESTAQSIEKMIRSFEIK